MDEIAGVQVLADQPDALPVYDPGPLDEFVADLGAEGAGVRADLFEAFLGEGTGRFVALVSAHEDTKGDVLASIAHTLRSASAALGLVALSITAADIEVNLRTAPERVNVALESTRLLNEFQRATIAIGSMLVDDGPRPSVLVDLSGTTVRTVLVVDDDPVSQRACAAVLTKLGYNTNTALNGLDALKDLALQQYDAVLMDFRMPVLDGFLTARELRHREGPDRHTPVIALASPITEWDPEMCLEACGMDDFLTKPIDVAKLTAILAYWVNDETD